MIGELVDIGPQIGQGNGDFHLAVGQLGRIERERTRWFAKEDVGGVETQMHVFGDHLRMSGVDLIDASLDPLRARCAGRCLRRRHRSRSEEHTSELQSLMRISYAVFCLKKKNKTSEYIKTHELR